MAEVLAALAVVATVAQLADYGFKLSIKLFNFSEAVSSADKSIASISRDVSLTSTVLKELCLIIQDDKSRVVSEGALIATAQTVKDCLSIFEELEGALDKSMGVLAGAGSDGKGKASKRRMVGERLKWPFKQQKMELLRSNLDRLKASLTLMLQVLSYAKDVSNRKVAETSLQYQQHLIESLARSEKDMKRKYYELQRAIGYRNPPPYFDATVNTALHVSSNEGLGINANSLARDITWPSSGVETTLTELSLFLNLFVDLLNHYIPSVKDGKDVSHLSNIHEQLRAILSDLQLEHQSLEGNSTKLSDAMSDLMNRISNILSASPEMNEISQLPQRSDPGLKHPSLPILDPESATALQFIELCDVLVSIIGTYGKSVYYPQFVRNLLYQLANDLQIAEIEILAEAMYQLSDDKEKEALGYRGKGLISKSTTISLGTGSSTDEYTESDLLDSIHPRYSSNYSTSFKKPATESQPTEIVPISQSSGIEHEISVPQAEVDQLTELMRQNILKVLQRGEKLDSMNDDLGIARPILNSASFYRSSKQQQEGLLNRAYNIITDLGSVVYNAGASLVRSKPAVDTTGMTMDEFCEAEGLMYDQSWREYFASFWPKTQEESKHENEDEDEDVDGEAMLDGLLAKWTNLPQEKVGV